MLCVPMHLDCFYIILRFFHSGCNCCNAFHVLRFTETDLYFRTFLTVETFISTFQRWDSKSFLSLSVFNIQRRRPLQKILMKNSILFLKLLGAPVLKNSFNSRFFVKTLFSLISFAYKFPITQFLAFYHISWSLFDCQVLTYGYICPYTSLNTILQEVHSLQI